MKNRNRWKFRAILWLTLAVSGGALAGEIQFEDVTKSSGLFPHVEKWELAHGGGWGDVDGNGLPDVFIGAFADRPVWYKPDAPVPNMLFLQNEKGFVLSEEKEIRQEGKHARVTCALLADMDNDGDLELVMITHARGREPIVGNTLYENDGKGKFKDVTPKSKDWPGLLESRNWSVLDMDGDGLLDFIVGDGSYGKMHDGGGRLLVLRNKGGFDFEEVSARYGFPDSGMQALGMAVGDVNNDGRMDIFVADSNRLFVSLPNGRYEECQPGKFIRGRQEPEGGRERMTCGAAFGDLNGDGLLDLVTVLHGQPASMHVYLNKEIQKGKPNYVEITRELGLEKRLPKTGMTGLAVKLAHLALRDMDNDGRLDILLALLFKDEQGRQQPVVLRNLGNQNGMPRFTKLPYDRLISYYATAPEADYDRDGRMDIFCASWFTRDKLPTALYRNVTEGGHWLEVRVKGDGKTKNTMGIGSVVRVYKAGSAGKADALLGRYDMTIGNGYASGQEALAHIGLGDADECDVLVTWAGEERKILAIKTDQLITVDF